MSDIELPDPKYIYHKGLESGEDDLFLFADSGDVACPSCERLYTAEQMRAYAIADREKRAQAAQPVAWQMAILRAEEDGPVIVGWKECTEVEARFSCKPVRTLYPHPPSEAEPAPQGVRGLHSDDLADAAGILKAHGHHELAEQFLGSAEASKPVQAEAPTANNEREAPGDADDPLTPEQEEWVMDLAEKHNLGRRMSGSTPRGLAPDVFYTDASYRTYELFCFAAELLKSRGASDV